MYRIAAGTPLRSGPAYFGSAHKKSPGRSVRAMFEEVPKEGLEPSLDCSNWILNPARLPIPPLRLLLKMSMNPLATSRR